MTGLVTVGYISGPSISDAFTDALDLLHASNPARLGHPHWKIHHRSGVNVALARNQLVYEFLRLPTRPDWLLMVDTDMVFDPGALESLLTEARPDRIVGGLCVTLAANGDVIATIYDEGERQPGIRIPTFKPVPAADVSDCVLREVYGTGAAFLLVHRQAFAAVAHCTQVPYPWFREQVLVDDRPDIPVAERSVHWIGEDLYFCLQARAAGCRIFVHTGVHIEHVKPVRLTERLWREGVQL